MPISNWKKYFTIEALAEKSVPIDIFSHRAFMLQEIIEINKPHIPLLDDENFGILLVTFR